LKPILYILHFASVLLKRFGAESQRCICCYSVLSLRSPFCELWCCIKHIFLLCNKLRRRTENTEVEIRKIGNHKKRGTKQADDNKHKLSEKREAVNSLSFPFCSSYSFSLFQLQGNNGCPPAAPPLLLLPLLEQPP